MEVPDFDAFCGHADHQEQVDGRDDAEDDVPEPEKGEDLLWDDVWREHAEVVLLRGFAGRPVLVEVTFGHPGERLVQDHRAVHFGVEDCSNPVETLIVERILKYS